MGEKNEHETLRAYLKETEGTMYAIGGEWERKILAEYDALRDEVARLKEELDALTNWHNAMLAACYEEGIDVEAIRRHLSTEGEEE